MRSASRKFSWLTNWDRLQALSTTSYSTVATGSVNSGRHPSIGYVLLGHLVSLAGALGTLFKTFRQQSAYAKGSSQLPHRCRA